MPSQSCLRAARSLVSSICLLGGRSPLDALSTDATSADYSDSHYSALTEIEQEWQEASEYLKTKGYMLRPRCRKDWRPSWRQPGNEGKDPREFEDHIALPLEVNPENSYLVIIDIHLTCLNSGRKASMLSRSLRDAWSGLNGVAATALPEKRWNHPRNTPNRRRTTVFHYWMFSRKARTRRFIISSCHISVPPMTHLFAPSVTPWTSQHSCLK